MADGNAHGIGPTAGGDAYKGLEGSYPAQSTPSSGGNPLAGLSGGGGGMAAAGMAIGGPVGAAVGAAVDVGLAVDSWLGARAAKRAKKQQRNDMIVTMEDAGQRAEASRRGMYDLLLTRLGTVAGAGAFGGKSPMEIFKSDPRAGTGRHLPAYNPFMDSPESILPSEDYYKVDMMKEKKRFAEYSWYKQYEDVHGPGAKPKEVPAYNAELGEQDPGYRLYDDGTKEYPDGTRVFPNGTKVDENGEVTGPDGQPRLINQSPIYNAAPGVSPTGPQSAIGTLSPEQASAWEAYMNKNQNMAPK